MPLKAVATCPQVQVPSDLVQYPLAPAHRVVALSTKEVSSHLVEVVLLKEDAGSKSRFA